MNSEQKRIAIMKANAEPKEDEQVKQEPCIFCAKTKEHEPWCPYFEEEK